MDYDEQNSIDSFFSDCTASESTITCETVSDSPIYDQQRALYDTLRAQKNRKALTRYIKKRSTSIGRAPSVWHTIQEIKINIEKVNMSHGAKKSKTCRLTSRLYRQI